MNDRMDDLTNLGAGGWLAIAAWAALVFGGIVLLVVNRQIKKNRALKLEQVRPQVAMFMEPHAVDWHIIELVVRNFGQTAAYDVRFDFVNPPDGRRLRGQKLRRAPGGRRTRTAQRTLTSRAGAGVANGLGQLDQPRGAWRSDPFALRRDVDLLRPPAAGGRQGRVAILEQARRVRLEGDSRLGDAAAGASPGLDDVARPRQAREAEARAASRTAELLPPRHEGDAARRAPRRDRPREPRRGGGSRPLADQAGGSRVAADAPTGREPFPRGAHGPRARGTCTAERHRSSGCRSSGCRWNASRSIRRRSSTFPGSRKPSGPTVREWNPARSPTRIGRIDAKYDRLEYPHPRESR